MDQKVFLHTYRGRQSALHHASYLRMSKVLLSMSTIERLGIDLRGARILDFGFGAGTFFRYCPRSSVLVGVEQDQITIDEVGSMLRERGHTDVELQAIDPRDWEAHPLLAQRYDLIHLSHVLEHLPDPGAFVTRIAQCLASRGQILGLVPLNERATNPHHIHRVDRASVESWALGAGLELRFYEEADPLTYWLQPLYTANDGLRHRLAQALSLAFGVPATLLGPRRWSAFGAVAGRLTRSLPTQAVFVLAARSVQSPTGETLGPREIEERRG